MPLDLSLPLFAASGLALGALVAYFGWPQIRMRIYNKTHGNLRVVEVAFILSHTARARQPARRPPHGTADGRPAGAEFVIYMTLKTGNL
jgi:hypothetical protein